MAKFNVDEMMEAIACLRKEDEIANFKDTIKSKGILPILEDGKLFVYKISGNRSLIELSNDYKENMFDIYKKVVLNDQKFKSDICSSSYLPFFRNMLNCRPSTPEEIWEKFNLDDEQSRKEFIEKNAREVEIHIPVDDIVYTKGYRKEEIQEIVQRISHDCVTCIFKRNSKLSVIIDFIGVKNYFDLDFIASLVYEFLYSKSVNFSTGITILREERRKIDEMQFTDKERSLSEDEKISIINNIIDAFNIELVYCEEVDKISDFQLKSMFGTNSRELVIDFSKHNNYVLYNSDFSAVYSKIISSKSKALKKKPN